MKPLAIDLFCGLGGWTEGLLAEGYEVVGFDNERHVYGEHRYPAQLVVQDVLTLHGSQFKSAALIVASPPCQEYSYMAMPWTRAKAKAEAIRADTTGQMLADLNRLFDACFRIQREASAARGGHIPMVVENVKGAQPWVGRARWAFGSFFLWGDVPALMPIQRYHQRLKVKEGEQWNINRANFTGTRGWDENAEGRKGPGQDWSRFKKTGVVSPHWRLAAREAGHKQPGLSGKRANGKGDRWFQDGAANHSSKSSARKMASAMIAKIPLALSRHIAATYKPAAERAAA